MTSLLTFLKFVLITLTLKLSSVYCDIISFQTDCIKHCELRHPRRGPSYPVSDNPTQQKYTTDDISFAACKQRCRLAEVIRPKRETEAYTI